MAYKKVASSKEGDAKRPKKSWPGPTEGYVEMLDEALVAGDQENQLKYRREKNPLRPSSSGECERKLAHMYREYLGLDPVTVEVRDAALVRLLDLGHWIESHILRQYRKVTGLNADVYNQQVVGVVEYEDGTITEGQIDMCFRVDGEDYLCVADAKSKKDKFSSFHRSSWDETAEAYAKMKSVEMVSDKFFYIPDLDAFLDELKDPFFAMNFYQLNGYIHSEFLQRRNADHGSIIQYNKNDSRMREFRFVPSKAAHQYVVDKYQNVKDLAPKDVQLTLKEFTHGSVKCAFCAYAPKCWPGINSKQEYFDTFPKKKWPTDTAKLGEVGETLEELFESYKMADEMTALKVEAEREICGQLDLHKIQKVRLADGSIYELKQLKTGLVVRRSKL